MYTDSMDVNIGNEYITSCLSISRSNYENDFEYLVKKINDVKNNEIRRLNIRINLLLFVVGLCLIMNFKICLM